MIDQKVTTGLPLFAAILKIILPAKFPHQELSLPILQWIISRLFLSLRFVIYPKINIWHAEFFIYNNLLVVFFGLWQYVSRFLVNRMSRNFNRGAGLAPALTFISLRG